MKREMEMFKKEVQTNINELENDAEFHKISEQWFCHSMEKKYSYNFRWMGFAHYPISAGYCCNAGNNLGGEARSDH